MVAKSVRRLACLACMLLAADVGADPLFDAAGFLQIRLTGPLRAVARDRDAEPEYRPATLTYSDGGRQVDLAVGIRPRGNSRRDHHVCSFPPLRLNFSKKQVRHTLFDGQDKLKLVSYCRSSARYASYVYKEYLAYRMLNQVTDASFRVRGLDVEYVDTDRGGKSEHHFGFFIEDKRRLAERLGLKAVQPERIAPARLEPAHASLMELFQFMIGNTDFSFIAPSAGDHCCHNAVLLVDADGRYLPMPYDFDISGFVDPSYAVVDGRLPISSVRERIFRGFCRDGAVMKGAVARYRAVRAAVLDVVTNQTPLAGRARDAARRYVNDFFAILDDPDDLDRFILSACRG